MNFEEIEDSIVARLAPLADEDVGYIVQSLPEREKDLNKAFAKPTITVQYHSSKAESDGHGNPRLRTSDPIQQDETVHVQVILQAQKLRGANGLYTMLEVVRLLLIGFKPTNCRKLFLVDHVVTKHEQQVWTHCLTLGCTRVVMEQPDALVEAILKRIKTNDTTLENSSFTLYPDAPVIEDASEATTTSISINIFLPVNGAQVLEYDISTNADFSGSTTGLIDLVDVWVFTGLTMNVQYYIRLRGKNDHFEGLSSNTLVVSTLNIPPLVIVTQPVDTSIPSGENGSISVVATGQNIIYQWQYKFGRAPFSNIAEGADSGQFTGTNTDTLIITGSSFNALVRCYLTSDNGTLFTNQVNLITP